MRLHMRPAGGAEMQRAVGVLGQLADRAGQCGGLFRRHQLAGAAIVDQLASVPITGTPQAIASM